MNGTRDPSSLPRTRAYRHRPPGSDAPGISGGFGSYAELRSKGAESDLKPDGPHQKGQAVLDRQALRRILSKVVVKAALNLKRR